MARSQGPGEHAGEGRECSRYVHIRDESLQEHAKTVQAAYDASAESLVEFSAEREAARGGPGTTDGGIPLVGSEGAPDPWEQLPREVAHAEEEYEGIMAQSTLAKKLRMQPGQRALILNAPHGYIESLQDLPGGFEVSEKPSGKHGFVQLFVQNSAEYQDLIRSALDALEHDAVFWICYPKKSSKVESDLSRDVLCELTGDTGLRPVTQVSIDAVWSALRYRPSDQVGK